MYVNLTPYNRLIDCMSYASCFRLLQTSGRRLGDWGFQQMEVVADRLHNQPDSVWNVEEHRNLLCKS
jgi:dolichyl-phosphate-mannose--protein O-mannosyl transferase